MELVLREDLADGGHLKLEDQAEEGFFFSGGDDLADDGEIDGGEEKVFAVADMDGFADVDALLALKEDDETGLVRGGGAGGGGGAAVKAEAGDGGGGVALCDGVGGNFACEFGADFGYAAILGGVRGMGSGRIAGGAFGCCGFLHKCL